MIVVGFFRGHNSTACILKDGVICAAVSEERFNREKNTDEFPIKSIQYCLDYLGIKADDVDLYVRTYTHPEGFVTSAGETKQPILLEVLGSTLGIIRKLIYWIAPLRMIASSCYEVLYGKILTPYYQDKFKDSMSKFLKIPPEKIIFADHHLCHAYAAYYGFVKKEDQKKSQVIVTLDGSGDGDCGGVWIVKDSKWKRISRTLAGNSLALLYGYITQFLGMKLNEHEYKIMGLAPYVSEYEMKKVYPFFKDLFSIQDDLTIKAKIMSGSLIEYFDEVLKRKRFDGIAAAAQHLVEEITQRFIKKIIKKTKIKNIVLAGGLFMNVKANKKISEMKELDFLTVCPSAADESTVFGAAYFGYKKICGDNNNKFTPQNINNLYLGPEYTDKEILGVLKDSGFKYKKISEIDKRVAGLLSEGKIVARFKGRMEWGARALGNRSILMDPRRKDLVQVLNSQIKSRDFWMPFAASVLEEDKEKYLVNIKNSDPRFMIMSYDTTKKGAEDLAAGTHPFDNSCRPQVVNQDMSSDYYKLISEFKRITGVGGVLNTSFNYHGEPVVCSPSDALNTFSLTGLEYLAIGNYLVTKDK